MLNIAFLIIIYFLTCLFIHNIYWKAYVKENKNAVWIVDPETHLAVKHMFLVCEAVVLFILLAILDNFGFPFGLNLTGAFFLGLITGALRTVVDWKTYNLFNPNYWFLNIVFCFFLVLLFLYVVSWAHSADLIPNFFYSFGDIFSQLFSNFLSKIGNNPTYVAVVFLLILTLVLIKFIYYLKQISLGKMKGSKGIGFLVYVILIMAVLKIIRWISSFVF